MKQHMKSNTKYETIDARSKRLNYILYIYNKQGKKIDRSTALKCVLIIPILPVLNLFWYLS